MNRNTSNSRLDDHYRPVMVNGFWPEEERDRAQAAAEELAGMGLSQTQTAFSAEESAEEIEYSKGGLIDWLKAGVSLGDSTREEVATPPVVLRTWPPQEMVQGVIAVMQRHGAYKVNHWESRGIQADETSADDISSSRAGDA